MKVIKLDHEDFRKMAIIRFWTQRLVWLQKFFFPHAFEGVLVYSSYCGFFEPSHFIPLSRPLVPFFCAHLALSRPQHRRLKEWVRRKRKRHETRRNGNPKEPWCTLVLCIYIYIYCIYIYVCVCVDIQTEVERERKREIFWGLLIAAEFIHTFLLKVVALIPERPTRIPQAVASVPVPIVMEAVVLMPVFLAVEKHPSISLRPKIAVLFCRTQASHPGGSFSLRMLKRKDRRIWESKTLFVWYRVLLIAINYDV